MISPHALPRRAGPWPAPSPTIVETLRAQAARDRAAEKRARREAGGGSAYARANGAGALVRHPRATRVYTPDGEAVRAEAEQRPAEPAKPRLTRGAMRAMQLALMAAAGAPPPAREATRRKSGAR